MTYKIYVFYAPLTEYSFAIMKNGEHYPIDNQCVINFAWQYPDYDNTIIRLLVEDLHVVEIDATINKPVLGWKKVKNIAYVSPIEFKASGFNGLDGQNSVDILNNLLNYALNESYDLKPYDAFINYFT